MSGGRLISAAALVLGASGCVFPAAGLLAGAIYGQVFLLDPTWPIGAALIGHGLVVAVFALFGLMMFVVYAAGAVALGTRQPWAWGIAVALGVGLLLLGVWPAALVVLVMLFRPDVRDPFRIEAEAPRGATPRAAPGAR